MKTKVTNYFPNQKRTRTLGLHHWTENEHILCFYITKFGFTNLFLNSEEEAADFIGVSRDSFHMQGLNFCKLLGRKQNLSDYSTIQELVFILFNCETQKTVFDIVKEIIDNDEYLRQEYFKRRFKDYRNFTLREIRTVS